MTRTRTTAIGAALALLVGLALTVVGAGGTQAEAGDPAGRNLARSATLSASFTAGHNSLPAAQDGATSFSGAPETSYWGTWQATGRPDSQWLQADWPRAVTLDRTVVSFWTDAAAGSGQNVTVPRSWSLQWRDATGAWAPVTGASGFTTTRDASNETTFDPVTTTGLRATFRTAPDAAGTSFSAVGVSEWEAWGSIADAAPDAVVEVPVTEVRTTPGTAPPLPASLDVVRLGGRVTPTVVTWDAPPAGALTDGAAVPVTGTLAGLAEQATGTVWVRSTPSTTVSSVDDASVITTVGATPALPATTTATYDDGSRAAVPVTWASTPASAWAAGGVVEVAGAVTGADSSSEERPTAWVFVQPGDGSTPGPVDPTDPSAPPVVPAPSTPTTPATPAVPAAPAAPAASSLTAKVKPGKVRRGTRPTLRLRLTTAAPTGSLVVTVGRGERTSWTRTVAAGTTTVRLPKQRRAGRHVVRVAWVGSAATAPATARTTYRVTR